MKRFQVGGRRANGSWRRTSTAVRRLAVAAASAGVAGQAARAATYVFDPTGITPPTLVSDGPGTWDASPTNFSWFNQASGTLSAWGNTTADTAVFGQGGTGGTVNVGTVTAGTIQFNPVSGTTFYNLTGGTITLGGAATINLNAASGSLTPLISSVIAGTSGLNVTGNNVQNNGATSVLTLAGLNTYTGVTNVSGGVTLSVSTLANGGSASGIGASSNASGNLILNGTVGAQNTPANANAGAELLYTGGTQTTDRGLTLNGSVQDILNVSSGSTTLTVGGQVLGTTGSAYRFYKQGPGTLAFTFAGTNTFTTANKAIIASGTLVLGAVGQTDSFAGSDFVVGGATSPAGASAANPNVAALNLIAGTMTTNGQAFGLGNLDQQANQLLVANITGGTLNCGAVYSLLSTVASETALFNLSGGTINSTGTYAGSQTAGNTVLTLSGTNFSGSGTGTSFVAQAGGTTGVVNQSAGTFALNSTLSIAGSNTTTGVYNLNGGTLTVPAVNATASSTGFSSTFNFNGGTLVANASGGTLVTGLSAANVLAGGAIVNTQGNTTTIAQPLLSGATADGGLNKLGSGTLILTGASTYNGPTVVQAGTLQLGNVTTAGTLASTVPISGAGGVTYAQPLLSAAVTPLANTYTGVTTVTGGTTLNLATLPAAGAGGVASGVGASSNASNNLVLSGTAGSQNTFGNGVTLVYAGPTATTDRGLSFTGSVQNIINVSSASAVLTVAGQAVALAPTSGSYRFYKQGPGTLAFTNPGPNSFNNGAFFLVDAGTFQLGAPGQVNNIANGLIVGNQLATPGATPTYSQIDGTTNVAGLLAFSNGDPNTGQLLTASLSGGTLNVTGVQTIVNGTNNAVLTLTNAAVLNDTGNVQGVSTTGASSVINLSGTAQFNNTGTAISFLVGGGGGTATVNQTGGTATFAAGLQVTGTGTAVAAGAYNLSGGTLATASLSGNSSNLSSTAAVNFNGGTLQALGNTNASSPFVSGVTANVMSGGATIDTQAFNASVASPLLAASGSTGGLTKVGAGTLTLTAANTYAGPTTVSAGTLRVNGSTLATGTVLVPAGGTLGGNGSTGTVTVAGTITAGASATTTGTLTTAAESWNASGGYTAKVTDTTGTANDKLVMSGLTVAAGFKVTLQPTAGATPKFATAAPSAVTDGSQPAGSFLVIATDTEAGGTNPFNSSSTIAALNSLLVNAGVQPANTGDSIVLSSQPDGNGFDLIALDVVAAPEPASLLLLTTAAAPLMLGRRRRRSA